MIHEFFPERVLETRGIQSRIILGKYAGERAIQKVSGQGLTTNELKSLIKAEPAYRQQLTSHGVLIPENYSLELKNDHIEIVDQYIEGETVFELAREENCYWGLMVQSIVKSSGVYLDAKSPNFIAGNDGVVYVDTFPPMRKDFFGNINPYVKKVYQRDQGFMQFNFGDIKGQMTKLLSLAKRELPRSYEWIKETTMDILSRTISLTKLNYIKEQELLNFKDLNDVYQGKKTRAVLRKKYG